MKIQTILGKVRYQQDFIIFFNKVIVNIKFKTVKMTVVAVLVLKWHLRLLVLFKEKLVKLAL